MTYSSVGRGFAKSIKTGAIIVSPVFIVFFAIAALNAGLTITALQSTQGELYDAAWVQLSTGILGLLIGLMFSFLGLIQFKKEETYDDMFNLNRGWIIWGAIGFAIARILNFIWLMSNRQSISLDMLYGDALNIILSAAPFEEALFSLGLTTMFILLLPTLVWSIEKVVRDKNWAYIWAIVISSIIVSIIFGLYHIGAGYNQTELIYTMIARFAYCLAYFKSRNVMAPTFAHFLQNFLLFGLGI